FLIQRRGKSCRFLRRVVSLFCFSLLLRGRGSGCACVRCTTLFRSVTVCGTVLRPGADALLAPGWVPWRERLQPGDLGVGDLLPTDRKSTHLNSSHVKISYAVFCLKKKKIQRAERRMQELSPSRPAN